MGVMNTFVRPTRGGRLFVTVVLLAIAGLGTSCIRQQDEVLARPEDPQTQQSEQQQRQQK
jgi:hypothetical protein